MNETDSFGSDCNLWSAWRAGELCTAAPIIDRAAFFGEIQIAAAQISPDGQWISFLKPYKGTRNIWVKKAGEPFSAAKPMSAETKRPVSAYFWSRDAKFLLYA